MQHVHERPSKAYAWLTLALFAGVAVLVGAALFAKSPPTQIAQIDSPLPVQQVTPPITQPMP